MSTPVVKRPAFPPHVLEGVCQTIAATEDGLTGSEISKILGDNNITDTDPTLTKWKRLYNAFVNWQNEHKCSNHILKFIQHALHPSRYIGKRELYLNRLHSINKPLSFAGLELGDNGLFKEIKKSVTLTDAEQRANVFLYKLQNRNVHENVFQYCKAELLVDNYFHSVFEAVKSIADRLRSMTGVHADGNPLADTVFSTSNPLIRINLLATDTDRSEHLGLSNLIKGLFGLIRNPTAHVPKISFVITEEDALDIMTTVSLIHKRLDKAL